MAISAINLGSTFTNANGTSVVSGISSGINTESTINAIVAAQSAQVTPLNDQVTVNNNQLTALSTLQNLLTQLQSAASQLSDPQSPEASQNAFASVTTSITSNTSQAASNYLTATAAADTPAGTYTISNITSLASATTQQTSTTFNSATATAVAATATAGQFTAGTYTINGPGGASTVTLTAGDSLTQVANDFNAATSKTGIEASVLQTAPGVYTLVFTSTITGAGNAFDFDLSDSNGGTSVQNSSGSGAASLGDVNFAAAVDGTNAQFELNGVTITRTTNTISDLISGVTLNLLQNTQNQAGASFTLNVAPDTSGITSAITNFANAYNAFVTFYAQQTALTAGGTPASSAVLYSDSTLHTIYNQLTSDATSIVTGLSSGSGSGSGSANQLQDIGISFTTGTTSASGLSGIQVNNLLSIDSSTLSATVENNLAGVENVFGYNLVSSSPDLASFQSPNDTSINKYTVNIDETSTPPVYTATYTDSTGTQQTVNLTATSLGTNGEDGLALAASSGSGLAGLILIYSGTGNQSGISVSASNGIAAQFNDFLTNALTANTGLLATDEAAINTKNTSLQTQISSITTQVTNTRTELLQKFAALEAAISSANSSLNLLNATQSAQTASGG